MACSSIQRGQPPLMAPIPSASGSNMGWREHLPRHRDLSIFSISSQSYPRLNAARAEWGRLFRCQMCARPGRLSGNSVWQWQDGHGELPDRFPPKRSSTFSAHLSHNGRAMRTQNSKSTGPGCRSSLLEIDPYNLAKRFS